MTRTQKLHAIFDTINHGSDFDRKALHILRDGQGFGPQSFLKSSDVSVDIMHGYILAVTA